MTTTIARQARIRFADQTAPLAQVVINARFAAIVADLVAEIEAEDDTEEFGLGDWVVIDADGLAGQVTGQARGELWATATSPDGRIRNYCAHGDAKTGRWERDGFRWTRSTDVLAAEHDI